jgi:putative addiction module component (TIGR02574 family)
MAMTKEQLLAAAMELSPLEREELAGALFDSLGDAKRAEIDAEWLAECKRRLEAYKRGEVQASPVDEAIERVRSRVRQ